MTIIYNDPINGDKSSIGEQFNISYYDRKALIEAKKEMFFMPLANTKDMPAHFGKQIKVYHYLPILDDRNKNDQGIDANGATIVNGNLYGSSKDIGNVTKALPLLTEKGGRVNRVGMTRKEVTGSIQDFGFFMEYTEDSIQFDTDLQLYGHLTREMLVAATQITEAVLQRDLLNAANTIVYAGGATKDSEVTGEGPMPSVVSYDNLSRLNKLLNDYRTPKQTKIISGSRMIDTRVVSGGRIAYCSSDVMSLLRKMKDPFGNAAFVDVKHYANGTTLLNGEVGSISEFRFIEVPEMLHWAGAGAPVTSNQGYSATDGKYDVFPILVVGDESFTCIGFQTSGKSKFKSIVKKPGTETADRNDPYGKLGFSSLQWWYGILVLRPERLGLIKTVAPM